MASSFFIMDPDNIPAPGVPVGILGKRRAGGGVLLTWEKSAEKGLSGYRVYHFWGGWEFLAEDLSSQCDGLATVFYTKNMLKAGSLAVFLNNIRVSTGLSELSDVSFSLTPAPLEGDILGVDYEGIQGTGSWEWMVEDLSSQCITGAETFVCGRRFKSGTVEVWLNGARLIDDFWELSGRTFGMGLAVVPGDVLRVRYVGLQSRGSWNVNGEDLSAQCDGATQVFTTAKAYESESLDVFWNDALLGDGVTEVTDETFSVSVTPLSGDTLVVDYKAADERVFEVVGRVKGNRFEETGLGVGVHWYKVVAVRNGIESEASDEVTMFVPAPVAPVGVVVRREGSGVNVVSWSPSAPLSVAEGFEGYEVFYSDDGDIYTLEGSVKGQNYTDRDLSAATHYYKVLTKANGADSALTAAVSAVVAAPVTPTGLAIERLVNSAVRLSWLEASPSTSEEGFEGYEVHHSTDNITYTLQETVKGQSFTDRDLSPGTHYYKVLTKANGADSALTAAVSAVVAAPVTPTGLRVSRIKGQSFRITWNQSEPSVKYEGFEGYTLYHSTDNVTYVVLVSTLGELYLHMNLAPATHYYKVSHLANGAESALSAAVSGVIAVPVPFVKSGVVATAGVPVTLNIETALGRKGRSGTLICLGPGILEVEFSYDGGSSWTDILELRKEDYVHISDEKDHLEISDIRLDTDVSGTGYTVSIV